MYSNKVNYTADKSIYFRHGARQEMGRSRQLWPV